MRRPIAVIVPVLRVLLVAGAPVLHLEQGVPGAEIYPPGVESRDAYVALQTEFSPGETTPIVILADVPGSPTDPATIRALMAYADRLTALDGIDRVEGPFSIVDPTTGRPLTPEQVAILYAHPDAPAPASIATLREAMLARYVRGHTVRLDAISPLPPARPAATGLTPAIRALSAGDGITTQVGGGAATGYDFLSSQAERAPFAIGLTLLVSGAIIFLLFGSLILPLKAVIMTLLSISASFGALVWIFQDGNLSGWLDFTPGPIQTAPPLIMFCFVFGLSMDYEVLLLSRVREEYERDGDTARAVAEALESTGRLITGAAAIMAAVFFGFATARSVIIQAVGIGIGLAVVIDA